MKIPYCEMYGHCRNTIPLFQLKERIALGIIDEMRTNLERASHLYDEMADACEEYCNDHDLDYDALLEENPNLIEDVFWEGCSAPSGTV